MSCTLIGLALTKTKQDLSHINWFRNCCIDDQYYFEKLFKKSCQNIKCNINKKSVDELSISFDYYDYLKILIDFELIFEFILQPII